MESNPSTIAGTPSNEIMVEAELPSFLRPLHTWRVVLCITHGCCYTLGNLSRHLTEKHRIKEQARSHILENRALINLAKDHSQIVQPNDGTLQIPGLPAILGNMCHFDCSYRSINKDKMRQHYNQTYD